MSVEQMKTRTMGWAIRSSLKAYLRNGDFLQLKHRKITEIRKMDEKTFAVQYAGAWAVLKKCPTLVTRYRLKQNMTKDQVLRIIAPLSLQDCLEAVDDIPDETLVEQFELCVNDPENEDKSLHEQIDALMDKLTK